MEIISIVGVLFLSVLINNSIATTNLIRVPALDTSIVRSHQTANNFGYITSYRQAYTPHGSLTIQPFYTQSILTQQPIYSYQQHYPFYPTTNPIASQYPIFGGQQYPIQIGGFPGIPGIGGGGVAPPNPIQPSPFPIGGIPGIGGIASAPPGLSPTPVEGTVIDEDTVAVEAP